MDGPCLDLGSPGEASDLVEVMRVPGDALVDLDSRVSSLVASVLRREKSTAEAYAELASEYRCDPPRLLAATYIFAFDLGFIEGLLTAVIYPRMPRSLGECRRACDEALPHPDTSEEARLLHEECYRRCETEVAGWYEGGSDG